MKYNNRGFKQYDVDDVVQFNENHKWCGSFGIIVEVKEFADDIKYMIATPIPEHGTAFIFSMGLDHEFEYIGVAELILETEDYEREYFEE